MQVDVLRLAKLSRLKLSEDEVQKYEKEMEAIINMVADLPDISGETLGVDESNPMELREDVVKPSLKREEILRNAPQTQAGCIVVPKVVE